MCNPTKKQNHAFWTKKEKKLKDFSHFIKNMNKNMNPEILKFKRSHVYVYSYLCFYVFPYFYIFIISIWWQFVLAKVISCSNPSVINYPGEFFVEKNSSSVGLEFKDPFLTTYSPTWSKNKLSRVYEKCNHRNFRFNLKIGHLKFHRKTDIVRFQLLRFKLVKFAIFT